MHDASPESFFEALDPFGMELGLGRMRRLLGALGEPQRGLRVLQVAGTNGKGSAAATAASLLLAAGRAVGLYTSPHLIHLAERIRIGERAIDAASLAEEVVRLQRAMRRTGERPTYFEALTAAAIDHFARQDVDIAILEVGLGGRLDATSAVTPEVAIITRIGIDHTAVLGSTISAIAAEKAAILKPGTRAFIARQVPDARARIAAEAAAQGCECYFAGRDFALRQASGAALGAQETAAALLPRVDGGMPVCETPAPLFFERSNDLDRRVSCGQMGPLRLALEGAHQLDNAEVAIAAALALCPESGADVVRRGLADVSWPGRFQVAARQPLTIVDGAHNPDGARALAATCGARFPAARPRLVFSALRDKDVSSIAAALFPLAQSVHLAQLDNPRAMRMQALCALAQEHGVAFECHETIAAALSRARGAASGDGPTGWVLAAGSLYLVGEILRCCASAR